MNKYPITCVMKDARTFVGKKDAHMYVNLSGNSAMAKGGSGDKETIWQECACARNGLAGGWYNDGT